MTPYGTPWRPKQRAFVFQQVAAARYRKNRTSDQTDRTYILFQTRNARKWHPLGRHIPGQGRYGLYMAGSEPNSLGSRGRTAVTPGRNITRDQNNTETVKATGVNGLTRIRSVNRKCCRWHIEIQFEAECQKRWTSVSADMVRNWLWIMGNCFPTDLKSTNLFTGYPPESRLPRLKRNYLE